MEFLTHIDDQGQARMVDVTGKQETERIAEATGKVIMLPHTLSLIQQQALKKGDVLAAARLAGIMAAKQTPNLIPLCHPLSLSAVQVDFLFPEEEEGVIQVRSRVKLRGQTGAEMEALTAVAVACLTIYDMCKAVDREMRISDLRLLYKSGGKSGDFRPSEKLQP